MPERLRVAGCTDLDVAAAAGCRMGRPDKPAAEQRGANRGKKRKREGGERGREGKSRLYGMKG